MRGEKPHRNMTAFLIEKALRLRRSYAGAHHHRKDRQTRIQGIDTTEDDLRRLRREQTDVLGECRVGVLSDDGRHRSRPGECGGQGLWDPGFVPSNWPCDTPSSAARSANRSRNIRPSRFNWRRWPQSRGGPSDDSQRGPAEGLLGTQRPRRRNGEILWLANTATKSPSRVSRIHGGYGYSKDYEIERLMRDAPSS